ncbi:MAG: meiotic cell cortex C-terminal pleckstrin homology-domain-containing protein [Linnemannia gamsii]|nr:MAG: meiotic cell cortex C-terminal pleckstrin homology-domain-containing protein [Linnemannia gamsii]
MTKSRHEQDVTAMRKHAAGLQREKTDLLTKVDDLNTTIALQQRKLAKATQDAITLAQEKEDSAIAAEPTVEAPVLIQAPVRTTTSEEVVVPAVAPAVVEPKVASLARETSYAHQQSIISELQTKLSKEITEKEELITEKEDLLVEKEELVKMLADREETIETMRLEGVPVFEPTPLNELDLLQGGHGSRRAPDMDGLDDMDGYDHRNLSMSLSESGSRDFSNGRGSPFPTGGLFAELAQATSTTNVKAAAEYKDQEVMTEPIESWIHTIPGFTPPVNGVPSSTIDSADKDGVEAKDDVEAKDAIEAEKDSQVEAASNGVSTSTSESSDKEAAVVEPKGDEVEAIVTGKPGTETKQIPVDVVTPPPTTDIPAVADAVETTLNTSSDAVPAPSATETLPAGTTVGTAQDALTDDVQYTPSPAAHSEGGNEEVVEPSADTSVPQSNKSNVEDERRHTCDMSQTVSETSSPADSPPPVPAVPAEHAEPSTEKPSLKPEDCEFRVSFGSAFGGDQNAMQTGRIKSVYQNNTDVSSEQSQDHASAVTAGEQTRNEETSSKLETAAPLAVAAAVAAVTTAAAAKSTIDQKDVSSAEESSHTSDQSTKNVKDMSLTTPVTVQTEQPLPSGGYLPPGRPSTTVVEVSSHTTYTYAAPSTSQVNLTHLNNGGAGTTQHHHIITDSTGATIGRHPDYRSSPNGSVSSMSTDYNHGRYYRDGRRNSGSSNFDLTPTDPTMIQLITQTMIGDYLWKYTRRRIATMMNEKMHWRYVWVHPYTKTMHWSLKNPGAGGSSLQSGKSALIVGVTQVTEEVPNSDLPNISLVVQTTSRNIKLKAPTREKHDLWFRSISYLLSRPSSPGADAPGDNQTWSEVQANHHPSRSSSSAHHPTNDAVFTLRQSESGGTTLRKKSSLARIQGVFGRNSTSRDGAPPTHVSITSAVGSPRIGSSGAPLGVIATSAAEKRNSATNLVTAYPTSSSNGNANGNGHGNGNGNGNENGKHGASLSIVGGNGTLNGGSILALAESEQQQSQKQHQVEV